MRANTIYINDDHDLYCQFCEENVPSLEWKKHLKSIQHIKMRSACVCSRVQTGLFCKDCGFVVSERVQGTLVYSWCRLAEVGEEGLRLGKEFLSYIKEPMRSLECIRSELGMYRKGDQNGNQNKTTN